MNRPATRSAWRFFLLTTVLVLPFWLLGALDSRPLMPALPLSALGIVSVVGAATILSWRQNGPRGAADLLKRSFDFVRVESRLWYFPAVLLVPLVSVAAYGWMRAVGIELPAPRITVLRTLGLFLAFLVGALCEELGWSGYAIDPLQERHGPLVGALVVGVVWAAVHFVPLAQAHRSLSFVAWWTLGTVSMRVIIVWLYNHTGRSVFVASLFHAMSNVAWQLFPVDGSAYDPRFTSPILAAVAVLVVAAGGLRRAVPRRLVTASDLGAEVEG